MVNQSHENLTSFRDVAASSNRKFGVSVGAIFLFIAVWPVIRHHHEPRLWILAIGVVLLGLGLAMPDWLAPLNTLWFKLGLLLAKITNPIVMGVLFFGVVAPFAVWVRWRGQDLLRLKRDDEATTYWIDRDLSVPSPLSKQF